jgi:protoporphyrinogen oxidase
MERVQRLEFVSLALVLVVINHPVDTEVQRVYCADSAMPFHKIVLNHNSSPYLRSLPRHAVTAEVSYSPGKPPARRELEKQVVEGLGAMGIIKSRDEVHRTQVIDVEYGYPVHTHDREATVREVRDWLAQRRIHILGRFGEWAYINSDEALRRGLSLGRALSDRD